MPRKSDPRRPGPDHHSDDDTNMAKTERHELVAEAAAIFGLEAAAELAAVLRVPFEASQVEARL